MYRFITSTALVLVFGGGVAFGDTVPPWENPDQGATHYWCYDFNDGQLPPTVTSEGGNWDPGSDPTWTITSIGDPVVIQNGRLGIFGATQDSVYDIKLDIPNQRVPEWDKWLWFAFDWSGGVFNPLLTFGSDDPLGSEVVDIQFPDDRNTPTHVEGFARFHPQPASEWLNIHQGVPQGTTYWIDNFCVGSVCMVPEPSSLGLLTIAGLLMLRRRAS